MGSMGAATVPGENDGRSRDYDSKTSGRPGPGRGTVRARGNGTTSSPMVGGCREAAEKSSCAIISSLVVNDEMGSRW